MSVETYDELRTVCDVYSDSHGKAAALSGALTELWGFDTDEFRLPSEDENYIPQKKNAVTINCFRRRQKSLYPRTAQSSISAPQARE